MSKFLEGNVPTKLFPRDNKTFILKCLFFVWVKNMLLLILNYFARATIDLRKKSLKYFFFEDKSYSKIQRKIKRNA